MSALVPLLAQLAPLADHALHLQVRYDNVEMLLQDALYAALRRERVLGVAARSAVDGESAQILALVQTEFGDLRGLLLGRDDDVLDRHTGEGEWTLRQILRHAIAVELRYAAAVRYAAARGDGDPIGMPADRQPCDKLSPPDPEYAVTRTEGFAAILDLLERARRTTDTELGVIDDAALARPIQWGQFRLEVRERMHQMGVHLAEVTVHAEMVLDRLGLGENEIRRILRRLSTARGSYEHLGASSDVPLEFSLAALTQT